MRSLPAIRRAEKRMAALQRKDGRRFGVDWTPWPKQQSALDSPAAVLFYGGEAGGAKTNLLVGAAATRHHRSILFRREYGELAEILEQFTELFGGRDFYNGQDRVWRLPTRRSIELGAVQYAGNERKFQGRPHDLKAFDEICHFTESQFRYLCGWLRSTKKGQRRRIICTGNPPTDAEGEWVMQYWAPWLDPDYAGVPAQSGEIRWFVRLPDQNEDLEVDGPEPYPYRDEVLTPQSRTFIRAGLKDNPALADDGHYKAVLEGLPEPLRSQLLKGDFTAGHEDDAWQIIPTAWIEAAQARWTQAPPEEAPMDAMGVDVARGGADKTVLARRHDRWFAPLIVKPGRETPDGSTVATLVVQHLMPAVPVHIDVVNVGNSPYDYLKDAQVHVFAMNGSQRSTATDRTGKLKFRNKRAQWWWGLREALDPDYGQELALPPSRSLRADLAAPRWRLAGGGVIQVEEKEEIRKRLGRSPDEGEAVVYAYVEPPRGFDEALRAQLMDDELPMGGIMEEAF